MSYSKAIDLIPTELLNEIQKYVDGEYIYIPRKESNKRSWGTNTTTKQEINTRNKEIYSDYQGGMDINTLSESYYLSVKSIQRILLKEKRIVESEPM